MKSIKQLFRQPIKLFAGVLLISLAVAILTICIGQYTATGLARKNLDDRYTTIGLISDAYLWDNTTTVGGKQYADGNLTEEYQSWIDTTAQSRTDLVKTTSSTGLISAYIPDLRIDNFSRHQNGYKMSLYNVGYPYRCAMLTVTLTKIGTVGTDFPCLHFPDGVEYTHIRYTTFLCTGTIESEVGLDPGYLPSVGKTILLHVTVPNQEAFDALNLQVGQTYLVYGQDYNNGYRSDMITRITGYKAAYEQMFGVLHRKYDLPRLFDYDPMLAQFDCVMSLYDPAAFPVWHAAQDETGAIIGLESTGQYEVYVWRNGRTQIELTPLEEYAPNYQLPTIAPLNGSTAEEFLASEEGAIWQETLDKIEINNHSFPVLCVEKLGYQAAFAREQARIVEGRDFTESELANGEKVCIISQSVATINGLEIGDKISMRACAYDLTLSVVADLVQAGEWSMGTAFPNAAFYSEAQGFTSEPETYTIVGIYRQEDAWQNTSDEYGFTPNTIFVPKSSVTAEMITKEKGIYSTLVLHNGKMEEFQTLMAEAGYPDLFICYDQGYSEFVPQLDAYEKVSLKALYIGLAAYAVLVLLFVFLFPAMQRKALTTMHSLGTPRGRRMRHIVVSSLSLLLPGTVIGAFAGANLWTKVAERLMQSLNIQIPLEANMPLIAPTLAAAHLLLMAVIVFFTAIIATGNNSVMKRK